MSLTKLSLAGNTVIKLLPAMYSLESDIPAGDGKIINLFLLCTDTVRPFRKKYPENTKKLLPMRFFKDVNLFHLQN
jgi:hypothetical protein